MIPRHWFLFPGAIAVSAVFSSVARRREKLLKHKHLPGSTMGMRKLNTEKVERRFQYEKPKPVTLLNALHDPNSET